jgi:histidinol dehydrogenase
MLTVIKYPTSSGKEIFLKRPALENADLENTVRRILSDVRTSGDDALIKYSQKFDGYSGALAVSEKAINESGKMIGAELKAAMILAKRNIEKFHKSQIRKTKVIETTSGVKCWRRSVGIGRVGLYIPGGSAPLFSTVLMLGVPAKIAGCGEIVLCTPAGKNGDISPAILYAAKLCGIKKVFRVGGAQAIAALAYGTPTISKVDKIFGPGNQYVTKAKQLISAGGIAIDMPAGPSELAVLADSSCIPAFVAADLLSQAEHGADSQVVLVSDKMEVIKRVNDELEQQIRMLPRQKIAEKAISGSRAFLVRNIGEGLNLMNEYAPEHLIIACRNSERISRQVINAGSVFLGNYSCESAGDYASGTNHTLPTNGLAKAYSGVSLDSFTKQITFQKLSKKGIMNIGGAIERMAEAEGLMAHSNAVTIRIRKNV